MSTFTVELTFGPAQVGMLAEALSSFRTIILGNSTVYNKSKTAAWFTALQNRETTPVNLVVCGHSWWEGYNSMTRGARLPDVIQTTLEGLLPTTGVSSVGGTTYIPCDYSQPSTVHTYTALLGAFAGGTNAGGFGRRYFNFTAIGHGASYTYTCTGIDVHWYNIGSGGTIRVNIDGGTTPGVTQFDIDTSLGTVNAWSKTAIPMPSNGSHTIAITCLTVGVGTILFGGMMVYRGNESKGLRIIDASRQGSDSTHNNCGDTQLKLLNGFTAVAFGIDINDYNAQTAAGTFKTNMAARFAEVYAQLPATTPIFLFVLNAPNNLGARTPAWSVMEQSNRELSDTNTYVSAIFASDYFPTAAVDGGTTLWDTDLLHERPAGATLNGTTFATRLSA